MYTHRLPHLSSIYIFPCPHSTQPYLIFKHFGLAVSPQFSTVTAPWDDWHWIMLGAPHSVNAKLVESHPKLWERSCTESRGCQWIDGFDKTESILPILPTLLHMRNIHEYSSPKSMQISKWGAQRWMIAMTCQPSDLRPLSATIAYIFSAQQGTRNSPSVFVFWDPVIFLLVDLRSLHQGQTTPCPTNSPPVDQPGALEASKDFPLHIADCTLLYSAPWLLCALEVCASLKPPEPLASALLCKSFWRILDRKIDSLDLLHAETSDRFMHQTTWCSWIHICGIHAKLLITRINRSFFWNRME